MAVVAKALERMEVEVRDKLHGAAVPHARVEMVQRKVLTSKGDSLSLSLSFSLSTHTHTLHIYAHAHVHAR